MTSGLPDSAEESVLTPEESPASREPAGLPANEAGVLPSALAPGPVPAAAGVAASTMGAPTTMITPPA